MTRLHFQTVGNPEHPAILLLHGFMSCNGQWLLNQEALSERFYLRGLADVGGFGVGSDLTVQLLGGIGYQLTDHVAIELAYRYLKEDYDGGPSFSFDAEMHGPLLGISVTW